MNKKPWIVLLSLSLYLGMGLMAGQAFAVNGSCNDWNFALEYLRVSDQQQAIIPDLCGSPRWYFMDSVDMSLDPSKYTLLTKNMNTILDCSPGTGMKWWAASSDYPIVYANATDVPQACDGSYRSPLYLPAATAFVHPAPTSAAVVGWKSPFEGKVQVEVNLADLDAMCGDGQTWYIQKGNAVLASGTIGNGGSANWLQTDIRVNMGELIYVAVGPNGEYSCDTTNLDITVTRVRIF